MQFIETTTSQWGVFVQMRRVLLQADTERQAREKISGITFGSDRKIRGEPWSGAYSRIRQADPDETKLSPEECWIAVWEGLA
jgi:hypothetical protein